MDSRLSLVAPVLPIAERRLLTGVDAPARRPCAADILTHHAEVKLAATVAAAAGGDADMDAEATVDAPVVVAAAAEPPVPPPLQRAAASLFRAREEVRLALDLMSLTAGAAPAASVLFQVLPAAPARHRVV
jgi:hypothetical protein